MVQHCVKLESELKRVSGVVKMRNSSQIYEIRVFQITSKCI